MDGVTVTPPRHYYFPCPPSVDTLEGASGEQALDDIVRCLRNPPRVVLGSQVVDGLLRDGLGHRVRVAFFLCVFAPSFPVLLQSCRRGGSEVVG